MRNKSTAAGRFISAFLSVCLILTLCSASVFADPSGQSGTSYAQSISLEGTDGTDEAAAESAVSDTASGELSGQGAASETDNSGEVNPGDSADENGSAGSSDNNGYPADDPGNLIDSADASKTDISTEESRLEEEEFEAADSAEEEDDAEEEAEEFEETGEFDLLVVDSNGSVIRPWYDSSSNIYYMFLTNAVSLNDLELQVEGIRMKKTSRGTLDEKTNIVTGAFSSSGDSITLTDRNGVKYNIVVKQSGLPSVSITLNGVSLSTIHANGKSEKYKNQSVLITDASGNINVSETGVEFKGRGNTTWHASRKKPYQIKFSGKQSVLGMAKAKKWVLLANSFDDAMLRNKTAYYLGDALDMTYTPDMEFVDLWIDGEYLGTYTIGEKCEIDSNRLNLTDSLGALVEVDNAYYAENEYYYLNSRLQSWFCLSEEVDESNSQETINSFQSKTSAFSNYLKSKDPANYTLTELSRYIDVDSFAKWYLIEEYLLNCDSYISSFYWYSDGASDVLHLGPVWDFDTSVGSPESFSDTTMMYIKNRSVMFKKLMSSPAFANYVKQVYRQYRAVFSSLPARVENWGSYVSLSADMNYTRWAWLGKTLQKGKTFENTYAEAVSYMSSWLRRRDTDFGISVPSVPTAQTSVSVSAAGKTMTLKASDVTGTTSIRAAVWSQTGGQDDLKWYTLTKGSGGTYSKKVDLTAHGSSDTYHVHFYSGSTLLGALSEQVTMSSAEPEASAEYNADTGIITVTVKNVSDYSSLNTAIWSAQGGQDDIKWINASVKSKNEVSFTMEASSLKHTGNAYIHVYGTRFSKQSFLTSTTVTVTESQTPEITAVQTDGGSILDIKAEHMAGWTDVKAAVWGQAGGQNDIVWYSMTRNSDGSWTESVNLGNHKETGRFFVHVYGKKSGKQVFAGAAEVTVTEFAAPEITVTTVKEGETLKAVLKNVPNLDSVSIAVWGNVGGQNDIKWYNAKQQSNGSWSITVNLENHREIGAYYFHAYGKKSGKQTFQAAAVANVASLSCPYLEKWLSDSGKTLNVSLENASAYSKVRFAVWGAKNGQNDLKWYSGTKNLDGSWSAAISLAAHGETGVYNIHTYGTKNKKDGLAAVSTVEVNSFGKVSVSAADRGTLAFQAKAENSDDYSSVRFAVWTDADGQDDLRWYTGLKYPDSSTRATVLFSAHGGDGTYNIHAYGTKNGKETMIGNCTYKKTGLPASAVTAELNKKGTKINITVDNAIGYTTVKAAVWGTADGQNDIKWYTLTKNEEGLYEGSVTIADHGETGQYNIHVYGSSGGKQFFMCAGTQNV